MQPIRDILRRVSKRPEPRPARGAKHVDREVFEGAYGDWREDAHTASGDGTIFPALSDVTPEGLYEEFERDEAAPADQAP